MKHGTFRIINLCLLWCLIILSCKKRKTDFREELMCRLWGLILWQKDENVFPVLGYLFILWKWKKRSQGQVLKRPGKSKEGRGQRSFFFQSLFFVPASTVQMNGCSARPILFAVLITRLDSFSLILLPVIANCPKNTLQKNDDFGGQKKSDLTWPRVDALCVYVCVEYPKT